MSIDIGHATFHIQQLMLWLDVTPATVGAQFN